MFNATFSNISAISWRPVLVVEEAGVPGENHRPWAVNWQALSLAAASGVHFFYNLQNRARIQAVLVIGLNELLGIPSTLPIEPPGPLFIIENLIVTVKLRIAKKTQFLYFKLCLCVRLDSLSCSFTFTFTPFLLSWL